VWLADARGAHRRRHVGVVHIYIHRYAFVCPYRVVSIRVCGHVITTRG
jgi:hypothetical protein